MSEDEDRQADLDAKAEHLRLLSGWSFVITRPKRLGVAVSGGSDSMALLDLMIWHGRENDFEVVVVSVDHGIRAEAKDECAFVASYCAKRDIAHSILEWEGWDGTGNLQANARKARYELISKWALRKGVDYIALGHTRDDQAETVLMRLARQSGVDGLAGMPEHFDRNGLHFIRPLLSNSRDELRDYLRHHNLTWCEDPTNEDDSYERVRMRKAMPALSKLGIDAEALTRVAWHARSAKWALDHYLLAEVRKNGLVEEEQGDLILPERTPTPENDAPYEIHRRAMNKAVQWISGAAYPPRAMALMNMSAAMISADHHTLGGCSVSRLKGAQRHQDKLRITREYNAVKDVVSETDTFWDSRWKLDGPHAPGLEVRALGDALFDCPEWRKTGIPRRSLLSSPSVWQGNTLVSAPVAGFSNGWTAKATGRGNFADFLLSR